MPIVPLYPGTPKPLPYVGVKEPLSGAGVVGDTSIDVQPALHRGRFPLRLEESHKLLKGDGLFQIDVRQQVVPAIHREVVSVDVFPNRVAD
jgi:hypothetical protein